jgi:hypothetical protein
MAAENRGLLKALQAVASGSLQVAEFTPVVLSKALDELLFQISKDYGIDYKDLRDKYKQPIIEKHAAMPAEEPRCKAFTKRTKKPCTRFPVLNGFCAAHADEMRKHEEATSRERELQAYQDKVAKRALTDDPPIWREARSAVQPVPIQKPLDALALL